MAKIESALEKYQWALQEAETRLGNFRKLRYANILSNLKSFQQIAQENTELTQQIKSWQKPQPPVVPTVKIS